MVIVLITEYKNLDNYLLNYEVMKDIFHPTCFPLVPTPRVTLFSKQKITVIIVIILRNINPVIAVIYVGLSIWSDGACSILYLIF